MAERNNSRHTVYENGFRKCEIKDDAPTFWYVFLTSFCPACGPCYADYAMSKEQAAPPEAPTVESKEDISTKLKAYVTGGSGEAGWPSNRVQCAAPVQIKMGGTALPIYKQPDALCTLCSICCFWRAAAIGFTFLLAVPSMLAAKYGLGMFAVCTISFCLFVSLLFRLAAVCFPKCFGMNTPAMRDVFANVVDMKRVDALEIDAESGVGGKASKMCEFGGRFFMAMLRGFFCCEFFRPSRIFTFAKVLIAMLFTDVAMVVSAYLFMVFRFACGSSTWTLGSFLAWVREYLNDFALKKRVTMMKYPAWGWDGKADGVPVEQGQNCGVQWFSCCPKCCSCCDIACTFCCEICGPLCCGFCNLGLDVMGDMFSAILLVGKALYFTNRMFDPLKANQGGGGETVEKANESV